MIVEYVDVCWMLVMMKVDIFVSCVIVLVCGVVIDMSYVSDDDKWVLCVVLLILIVKVFGIDVGNDVV